MATADATIPVRHLDLPDGNPTERFVNDVPREGEGGVFSETWYPICLSTDLAPGAVIGRPFLDGRVIVFRGEDGYARVMSAYCPHLGADLSVGSVEGNHVVCAFHRWEYDANGRCVRTAIGASFFRSSAVGLRRPALIRYEQHRMVSSTVIGRAL